jgi:hypothetical protein
MTAQMRLLAPRVFGNRTIIPVVRDLTVSCSTGVMISGRPVALLIGEGGAWGIALLEEGSVVDLLKQIVPAD